VKTQFTLTLSVLLALLATTSPAQIISPNGDIAPAPTFITTPAVVGVPVAAGRENATVAAATATLNEIMAIPSKGIPANMLRKAKGVVIVPKVLKGGFVIGVRHGRGVVLTRDAHGNWQAPYFCSLTGGSVGWQIGVQSTDVILVFNTQKSLNGLMSGKFTIGVDAAVAAGPVGRQAAAATDARLGAEILSYSRSRGLFLGVSLDGSAITMDPLATNSYYRNSGVTPAGTPYGVNAVVPATATGLVATLTRYAGGGVPVAATVVGTQPVPTVSPQPISTIQPIPASHVVNYKAQLIAADRNLKHLLDPNWDRYLALPAEIYAADRNPSRDSLNQAAAHFDTIAASPQYRALSSRVEFQTVHNLLKRYAASLSQAVPSQMLLPPPPNGTVLPAATLPTGRPPRY
jgi:lipid-binding SYLF domain-containing protein